MNENYALKTVACSILVEKFKMIDGLKLRSQVSLPLLPVVNSFYSLP